MWPGVGRCYSGHCKSFTLEVTCLSPALGPPGGGPDCIALQGTLDWGFPESPQPCLCKQLSHTNLAQRNNEGE